MDNAVIGLVGIILGILITRGFEIWDKRTENQKWFLQHLLPRQIDALASLHVSTIEFHDQLTTFPLTIEVNLPNIERLGPKNPAADPAIRLVNEGQTALNAQRLVFNHAAAKARIYMPDDDSLLPLLHYLTAANQLFSFHTSRANLILSTYMELPPQPPNTSDEEQLRTSEAETYKQLTDTLRTLLRPSLLTRFTYYKRQ